MDDYAAHYPFHAASLSRPRRSSAPFGPLSATKFHRIRSSGDCIFRSGRYPDWAWESNVSHRWPSPGTRAGRTGGMWNGTAVGAHAGLRFTPATDRDGFQRGS